MDSTTTTAPNDPAAGASPVAEFFAAKRALFAWVFLALGIIGLGGTVYSFSKVVKSSTVKSEKEGEPEIAIADPHRMEYASAGVFSVFLAIVGLGIGALQLAKLPRANPEQQLHDARLTILAGGGLLGLLLMLAGLWFFLMYFNSLSEWLKTGKKSESVWVLVPILVALVGAGLAFVAAQPARADERNNTILRRLVYGSNLGLSALLLLLLLLVGNVFAALKVPNKLDTTETGFYTLSEETKDLIRNLNQTVTVYNTLFATGGAQEQRLVSDVQNLLTTCHELNPTKFRVRTVHPMIDRDEMKRLSTTFPKFDREALGMLVVIGDPESDGEFIRANDLFDEEGTGRGPARFVFKGEAELVSKLLYLTENRTRPVIYFTQSNGELEVISGAAQRTAPGRAAAGLAEILKKTNADVKPLEFDLANPKVPDDATIVIIADPVTPIPYDQAEAIRKYMTTPRPDGKKGKLVVMSSPHPKVGGSEIAPTGLEAVLTELGVKLGAEAIVNQKSEPLSFTDIPAGVNAPMVESRNPIALKYSDQLLVFPDAREVSAVREASGVSAEAFFISLPGRFSWLEASIPTNPAQTWQDLAKSLELRTTLKLSRNPRSLSVLVTEPAGPDAPRGSNPIGRVAVYGTGTYFADPPSRERGGVNRGAELLAATVDWLRDRPAAANIASKTYGYYERPETLDPVRTQLIPIGVTLLGIIAFGLGIWVFRRA